MFDDDDDVITLHVRWSENGNDITADPCAERNATGLVLLTPAGERVAEWVLVEVSDWFRVWNLADSPSDYALTDADREALSGFGRNHADAALNAGVEWFRANCGVRSTMRIVLD